MKQEQRIADYERKLSEIEKNYEGKREIRGEIWQWTAKAYKNCSTNKMANRQSIKYTAIYLLSLATRQNLQTHPATV